MQTCKITEMSTLLRFQNIAVSDIAKQIIMRHQFHLHLEKWNMGYYSYNKICLSSLHHLVTSVLHYICFS